jgi:hypothetical protein
MASIVFTAGLDDTAFVRGITNMERTAQRSVDPVSNAFGRWGQGIERNTAGLRKFTGAISSSVGVLTSTIGAVTAIGAVAGGALLLIDSLVNGSKQAAEEVRSIVADIEQGMESARRARGNSGLNEFARARSEAFQARQDGIARLNELANAGASFAERDRVRDSIETEYERALAFTASAEAADRLARNTEALSRASGSAASFLGANADEVERLEQQVSKLNLELERAANLNDGDNSAVAEVRRLQEAVRAAGQERIDQIKAEREAREQAEAARLAMEQRRRELEEKDLDIQIMLAKGMKDEAEQARVRLDIERRLQQLRDDPSRSAADRDRIERKLRELQDAQLAGLTGSGAGGAGGAGGGGGVSTLGATLTGAERQIFGTNDSATQRQLQRMEQLKTIADAIKDIFHSVTESGSVKITGSVPARLT